MKTILAFSLFVPILGLFYGVRATGRNEKPKGELVLYEYSYSTTARFPSYYYEVRRDGTGMLCIGFSKDHEADIRIIRAPEDALEHIAGIAKEHRMHRLRGSYRPSMQVLDGYGWHCYLRYSDGSISSGGTHAHAPGKPGAGIAVINDYLRALIEASGSEDVIRLESHLDR